MFPCALARLKPETVPKRPKSQSDALLHALRNAKELALEVFRSASTGWTLWWLENVVLEYSARPDGLSISDALQGPSVPAFRYIQHTRTLCLERVSSKFDTYSHVGSHLPSLADCTAHKNPPVLEFVWPVGGGCIIKYLGRVAVACTADGILWLADPHCGYHHVPECELAAGSLLLSLIRGPSGFTQPMAK